MQRLKNLNMFLWSKYLGWEKHLWDILGRCGDGVLVIFAQVVCGLVFLRSELWGNPLGGSAILDPWIILKTSPFCLVFVGLPGYVSCGCLISCLNQRCL